tara:strand:- start:1474 stop:2019 length:546 start_codon:yes stop_codon:yes gene_type:complete
MLIPVDSLADSRKGAGAGADAGVRDITWADLAPGGRDKREYVRDVSPLASLVLRLKGDVPQTPVMAGELDGRRVRLSGYIVPLEFIDGGVRTFLLVPYVGACIHVPPPPKNQIVMVTSARPIEARGLFQAVTVTGTLSIADSRTEVAETGYRLNASDVSAYSEYRRVKRLQGHRDADAPRE